jgi:hypothetical protein
MEGTDTSGIIKGLPVPKSISMNRNIDAITIFLVKHISLAYPMAQREILFGIYEINAINIVILTKLYDSADYIPIELALIEHTSVGELRRPLSSGLIDTINDTAMSGI